MAATKSIAVQVSGRVDDHLQKHDDVYDPQIKRNSVLLVGEKGDNGICSDLKLLVKTVEQIDERTKNML
jgi:hypothetical protein